MEDFLIQTKIDNHLVSANSSQQMTQPLFSTLIAQDLQWVCGPNGIHSNKGWHQTKELIIYFLMLASKSPDIRRSK